MLGNTYQAIFKHRSEIVEALVSEGHEVITSFSNGMMGYGEEATEKYHCRFVEIPISRRTARITQELGLLRRYYTLMRNEKPDAVLAYTVKCDVWGGIAARMLNIPFFPNITGIGKGLDEEGIVQKILIQLYKLAVRKAEAIFFQNPHDRDFFAGHGIKFRKGIILPGSGVNLDKYPPFDYPPESPLRFLFNSRIMTAKGIEQYLDAAHFIKQKYPFTEFHICGYFEDDAKADFYRRVIKAESERGILVYHDLVNDMREYYRMCHCVILPSYHPEGVSNSLLEAASCARPIITTNHPGCSDAVDDGLTGFLIEPRNSRDLADKIERFIALTNDERKMMGIRGRRKMENEFDRHIVVDAYLRELNALKEGKKFPPKP